MCFGPFNALLLPPRVRPANKQNPFGGWPVFFFRTEGFQHVSMFFSTLPRLLCPLFVAAQCDELCAVYGFAVCLGLRTSHVCVCVCVCVRVCACCATVLIRCSPARANDARVLCSWMALVERIILDECALGV